MFKLIILFILLIVIWDKCTIKYLNPFKTILYMGKKGCGKTTYLTKLAINNLKLGKIVYCTEKIPGTRLFDPYQIEKYTMEPYSVVLFDEISMFFDNRDFKSFKKEYTVWFRYARQYKLEIHMFSQVADIDLKIRNLCDAYYLVENKLRVFSYAKRITKVLTVGHDTEGTGKIVDTFEFAPFLSSKARILTFIPRWSAFYNSYNPPKRDIIPYEQLDLNDIQQLSMNNHIKFTIQNFIHRFESSNFVKNLMMRIGATNGSASDQEEDYGK